MSLRGTDRRGRLALALSAAALLAGCNPTFREGVIERLPTAWKPVPAAETPAILPARGTPAVVEARTRSVSDAFKSYRIVFANMTDLPGENRLLIDIATGYDSGLAMFLRPERPWNEPLFTGEELRLALQKEFQGLTPSVGEAGRRNRYGLYDYAVGNGARGTCVFAWQLIDDHKRVLPETIDAIHMEWRQCDRTASVEDLLAPFDRMVLAPELGVLEDKDGK